MNHRKKQVIHDKPSPEAYLQALMKAKIEAIACLGNTHCFYLAAIDLKNNAVRTIAYGGADLIQILEKVVKNAPESLETMKRVYAEALKKEKDKNEQH